MTPAPSRSFAFLAAAFLVLAGPSFEQTADNISVIQARALELVNETRQEHGLPPLALEQQLNAAAQAHADDMFARHYYGHASPEGRSAADRYVLAGGRKRRMSAEK